MKSTNQCDSPLAKARELRYSAALHESIGAPASGRALGGTVASTARARRTRGVVPLAATGALLFAMLASYAEAARPATRAERRAIQALTLKACRRSGQPHCQEVAVQVSTVNPHYAFGGAIGDGTSGYLVRFSHGAWRIVAISGGGVMACSYWTHVAPVTVIRDLGSQGTSPAYPNGGPC